MPISVVTGAAGFVGQALVRGLLEAGDTVRGIVLPSDPSAEELRRLAPDSDRLQIVEGDVTEFDSIAPAFGGAGRIFHTAALIHAWAPWERFREVNVGGMRNVAEAALRHGVGRMLWVSTSDVFGIPGPGEVIDETTPYRRWNEPYADTKIEAERWLWSFARERGLPVTVIYPGWVYGPGDKAFFPSLAEAISDGLMMFWCRGLRLPWVYVDNLADACIQASAHPAAAGEGFLVHDETNGPPLEEVCAHIAAVIGKKPPTRHVPYALAYGAATLAQSIWRIFRLRGMPPLLTVDIKAFGRPFHLSTAKIRAELGWKPRVGVEEGMARALEYLREWRRECCRPEAEVRTPL